jgi:hypothetical protein
MLDLCGDDVRALNAPCEEDPLDRVVVGFAPTTRKDDFVRGASKESGNLRLRRLNDVPRRLCGPVIARWISERLVQHRLHPSGDFGRQWRAGIEVKVDAHRVQESITTPN